MRFCTVMVKRCYWFLKGNRSECGVARPHRYMLLMKVMVIVVLLLLVALLFELKIQLPVTVCYLVLDDSFYIAVGKAITVVKELHVEILREAA